MENLFKKDQKEKSQPPSGLIQLNTIVKSIEDLRKKMDDPAEISNLDEIKLHLRTELGLLSKNLKQMFSLIKIPDTFKIDGIPKFPDKLNLNEMIIRIEDLARIVEAINDLRVIMAQIEFNPTINVAAPEIPEIKIPKIEVPKIYVPEPKVTVNPEVEIDFTDVLKALTPLKHLSDRAGKPLSVRLSDGKHFIEALKEATKAAEKQVVAFGQANGLSESEFVNKFTKLTQAATIVSGRKAVTAAGTAEKLVATSTKCFRVDVCADLGNTNPVVVGGSGVAAADGSQKGMVLIPGNAPQVILIDDLSKLYVDAQTNNNAVVYNYYTR